MIFGCFPCKVYEIDSEKIGDDELFPYACSENAKSFLRALLRFDPKNRLGVCDDIKKGYRELKDHAWFDGFDWRQLEKRTMKAPYQPFYDGEKPDLRHFDSDFYRVQYNPGAGKLRMVCASSDESSEGIC